MKTDKMKIAMIGLRGIPAKSGGVENVVEHLAPLLVEQGCEVTVYCRNQYCTERPKIWKGVKLRYLPTINTKHTEAIAHTALSTMDSLFRSYDIVHFHAMGNGLFSLLPRITGKKTVVTLHGLDWEREKWGTLAKTYLKLSERAICTFPNRVISVSKKIKRYYSKKYKKDITFIPNGVDIMPARSIAHLKKFGLEKDQYILFLSRIVPEKGIHFLIEAYRELKTDVKLVIAGDATHTEDYLEKCKKLAHGDPRIILPGPWYGEHKQEAFSNARFFVLPSTIEGMPIVLLEAMSYGCCPLVSDIEENRDVILDAGFTFKSRDVPDLRKQLQYVLSNQDEAKAKGAACKEMVLRDYRWQVVAQKTLELYHGA
jgi:glycosyltransferase involved in cell wall biosynthesis